MVPPITFLLPVYNGEKYLAETLQSIVNQSFTDFETLIINDGSKDKTQYIIEQFQKIDPRIKSISRENRGLIATLNEGLDLIQSPYIARIDADDLCHRQRLELQFKFMEANPQVGVCGSNIKFFGDSSFDFNFPTSNEELKAMLIYRPSFAHPAVMLRKKIMNINKLYYDKNFVDCEDYKLWLDMADVTQFGSLPYNLLFYRKHGESISDRSKIQENGAQLIRQIALQKAGFSSEITHFHLNLCIRRYEKMELEFWPQYLTKLREKSEIYFKVGCANLNTFCQLYLPKEHAKNFFDCVMQAVPAQPKTLAST